MRRSVEYDVWSKNNDLTISTECRTWLFFSTKCRTRRNVASTKSHMGNLVLFAVALQQTQHYISVQTKGRAPKILPFRGGRVKFTEPVPSFVRLEIETRKLELKSKQQNSEYSKTCLKRPLKNRHNKGLNGKW